VLYISLSGLLQAHLPWGSPYILFVIADKGVAVRMNWHCVSLKVWGCFKIWLILSS